MSMTFSGDKAAQSYGWRWVLGAAVPNNGTVTIPTPGIDTRYTDVRYPSLALLPNGVTWKANRDANSLVQVIFNTGANPPTAVVTNKTGLAWAIRDEIYLYCPHLLATSDNEWDLKEQIYDLHQAIGDLQSPPAGVEDLETRMTAAEARLDALEAANAKAKVTLSVQKPPSTQPRAPVSPQRPR